MDNVVFNQMISELLESMDLYNVGLYIGQEIKMEELPYVVLSQKWRFIVTSQRRDDFSKFFFSEQRSPHVYSQSKEIQNLVFSSIDIPIVQLFGFESESNNNEDLLAKMLIDTNASDIMSTIANKLDTRSKFVVIGYDPLNTDELAFSAFSPRWYQIRGARTFFFNNGIVNGFTSQMIKIAESKNDFWCELSLADALATVEVESNSSFEREIDSTKQLFYKGNRATSIENTILLKCQNFVQLLTDESVNGIKPIGKIEQEKYFELFLDNSSVLPQWYGYSSELNYYLERPFEDTMYKLIVNALNGKELAYNSENKRLPIILEGDPGTSKSITLGAIAYKIFKNRKNPVVFIKNEEISFNNEYGREFDLLNNLLSEIERAPGPDERILIIWDTAAYRNVEDIVGNLSRLLDNLGRRFVLVCTAYRGASREDVNHNLRCERKSNIKRAWKLETEGAFSQIKIDERDNSGHCVYSDGRALFVATTRDLSKSDKSELSEKVRKYTDLDENEKSLLCKRVENENDIFMCYFQLRYELRERLAEGLSVEQRIIGHYVKNQLNVMTKSKVKEEKSVSPMVQAMLKAGIILEKETIDEIENEETKELEDKSDYDLNSFNISIALFSKYKLNVPYRLALSMLFVNSDRTTDSLYKDTQLLDFITTSIPWIFYGPDTQDRFIFRFRNSKEADIFLKNNNIDGEKQIKYLMDLFDVYLKEYYFDDEIKIALINLARMMGPNSEYYNSETENIEHRQILQNLNQVIAKLSTMRNASKIDNFDVNFAQLEITFTREYYGKLWEKILENKNEENSYEDTHLRLTKLKEVLELAQVCINKLDGEQLAADSTQKKYIQDQINMFAYEIAYCKIAMEELQKNFDNLFDDKKMDIQTPEYFQIYPFLVRAVNSNPVNGFSYNAMFKLFEHEYLKMNNDEQKLTILSEIRSYVEEARTLDIVNRGMNGRDEVQENIVKIEGLAADYPVDIDTIENGEEADSFISVFNDCLAKNKACAIVFVCQQELDKYKLLHSNEYGETDKLELSEDQIAICRKVYNFLSKEEYRSCVEQDVFAMYLKLRVAWLLFNKKPINIGDKEAQLTYISNEEQWQTIYDICETYINCKAENKKPIVFLIFALSIVQTTGDYVTAYKAIANMDKTGNASFASQARMRVPYIICEKSGEPRKYFGTLYNANSRISGYLSVKGIPMQMGQKKGVRVFANNIGVRFLPEKNSPIADLEVGIGYTGFSAYTEKGRKNRGDI